MKERDEQGTGEGLRKWSRCFDCGQEFHGAVFLALGWACWKTYVGRPDTDWYRCRALGVLGSGIRFGARRPEEALPVFEASLALRRRYWSSDENGILSAQANRASCLADLGRDDEALVLRREIFARRVATLGVSNERTILNGSNLAHSLLKLELWDEAKPLLRDQLLPVARRSLGADHHLTLRLNQRLAFALQDNPECTRDDPCLIRSRHVDATRFNLNTGDDLLEAETILLDVVRRRRRVFGPAHPDTRGVERVLSDVRAKLAGRRHA